MSVSTYLNVETSNVDQMKAALNKGPTSVAVEASMSYFRFYTSGVMDNVACGTTLDHAVLAVGYGNEDGKDYWLVKNSWGSKWGLDGYIKLAMVEGDGICGV